MTPSEAARAVVQAHMTCKDVRSHIGQEDVTGHVIDNHDLMHAVLIMHTAIDVLASLYPWEEFG